MISLVWTLHVIGSDDLAPCKTHSAKQRRPVCYKSKCFNLVERLGRERNKDDVNEGRGEQNGQAKDSLKRNVLLVHDRKQRKDDEPGDDENLPVSAGKGAHARDVS